jgi:hypothetical protein
MQVVLVTEWKPNVMAEDQSFKQLLTVSRHGLDKGGLKLKPTLKISRNHLLG